MKRIIASLVIQFAPSVLLFAHDPGLSTTEVVVRGDAVTLRVGYAPADLRALWPAADFAHGDPGLRRLAAGFWEVRGDSGSLEASEIGVSEPTDNSVLFDLTYPRPAGGRLTLRSLVLDRLPPGHRDYVTISDEHGKLLAEKLVDASSDSIAAELAAAPAPPASHAFGEFFRLGVVHIWTGYDHLLFLFGLLIVCRSFRSIAGIISCSTLAHSLTLALATLNVVYIPSRVVEPAIAASIAFVGVENLIRRGPPAGRWVLTFLFGLIHGFGFASVLRELGVGSGGHGLVLPLVSFNLGVEFGQMAIAAIMLPIFWHLRQRPSFTRRALPVFSAAVAAAGLFWFLQRTAFS